MPLSTGTFFRNSSKTSNPPAEAPMPTMGNGLRPALRALSARGDGIFLGIAAAG
jgi:hypothetical protein